MEFLKSSPIRPSASSWLILCLLICSALFPLACRKKAPVKLGFLGGLTGRVADLGMAGRDGAMLAIEQFNSSGGLHGQPMTLLTADDPADRR
jgi:branched-chain amino acid transport system substrate-binding protein